MIDEGVLQYFHAALNKEIFNNELSPAIIRIESCLENEEETTACTYPDYSPCLITFFLENKNETFGYMVNPVFVITVLLHEMIHQYCHEKGIKDTEEDGTHLPIFEDIACKFGLEMRGYKLSDKTKQIIQSLYLDVNTVLGIRDKFRRHGFD